MKKIEQFLPYLKDCIGNIDECRNPNNDANTFNIIKDSRLSEFIGTFYESNIANHDYINYLEERELKSQKDIDEKFDELTLDDLYSVLTLYIRQDRFVEGKLVALAENGTLNKLVQRITELKAH